MTVPTNTPPPGWYDDLRDPNLFRFWDGNQWSAHTTPKPSPSWGPPTVPAAGAPVKPSRRKPWWQRWWVVVTALLIALAIIWPNDDVSPSAQTGTPDPSAGVAGGSEPAQDADTQAAAPEPEKSTVPGVTGLARKQAEEELAAAGLVATVAREVPSPLPAGTVLRQLRKVGAAIREGSTVGLVVAVPYPMVPGTAGMSQAAATRRLRDAGFEVLVTRQVVTAGQDGVVLRQTPIGSRRAKPHSVVTLVVASLVRPAAQPAPSNCTPGYSPCLTPASDYDCEGGSGDGPRYTGFVHVSGSDPYDLDRDGDGLACES